MSSYKRKEAFQGWAGPRNARCVLVGEAHGKEEDEAGGQPFVGSSGKELWRILGEAWTSIWPEEHSRVTKLHRFGERWLQERENWLAEASIGFTNVFNFRPPDNKIPSICSSRDELPAGYSWPSISTGKYVRPIYLPELDRLFEELEICRPNLVVALGNTACWALLRTTAISQIRGTSTQTAAPSRPSLDGMKVLPTWHPAGLLYEGQWSRRPILVADLMKAQAEAFYPEIRRPKRLLKIQPSSIEEWESWISDYLDKPPELMGCDTETSLGLIDTISFSRSASEGFACQIGPHRVKVGTRYETIWPQRDSKKVSSYWDFDEEKRFWASTRALLESGIPILFQNGIYDLQYIIRAHIRPKNVRDDLMLLHHSLFPGMQKGLGFLGSIYTSEASWKLMRQRADSEKRDE